MKRTPKRIVVLGASGSGKTWLAKALAKKHNLSYIELDDLAWDKGWVLVDTPVMEARIERALKKAKNGWVIAGNYSTTQHVYWKDVEQFVWIDLPFIPCLASMMWRATKDVLTRRTVCNGNRQTLRELFIGKDALLWWNIRTFYPRRRKNAAMMAKDKKRWVRLLSRREATAFAA